MRLAKVSANGQITAPVRVRELLEVGPGDRIAFTENDRGEIVLSREPAGGLPMPIPGLAERAQAARLRREAEEELDRIAQEAFAAWIATTSAWSDDSTDDGVHYH
jgi:AbrB family looped-hinge helix DNA binding protein